MVFGLAFLRLHMQRQLTFGLDVSAILLNLFDFLACMFFVFLSLVEFAAVSFIKIKIQFIALGGSKSPNQTSNHKGVMSNCSIPFSF